MFKRTITMLCCLVAAVAVVLTPAATVSAADTEQYIAVASRTDGFADTRWRTRLWVVAGAEAADLSFEYYPTALAGLAGPAATATRSVAADSQLFIEDLLGDLFGVNGNGAVRLTSSTPVAAFARVVNVKMPAVFEGGTFGQAMAAMSSGDEVASGVFPGLFNERIPDESGFRTNIGWFNPTPDPVTVTMRVTSMNGELLGERTFEIAGLSQWLGSVFDAVWTVPQNLREQQHFSVSYETVGGEVFLYASVVDNVTGDAVTVLPIEWP